MATDARLFVLRDHLLARDIFGQYSQEPVNTEWRSQPFERKALISDSYRTFLMSALFVILTVLYESTKNVQILPAWLELPLVEVRQGSMGYVLDVL
jgi:hypothetical protein